MNRGDTDQIILGTAQLGLKYGINNNLEAVSEETAHSVLHLALEEDVMFLDTAPGYGMAHKFIGSFHSKSTRKFKVFSKITLSEDITLEKEINLQLKTLKVSSLEGLSFHKYQDFSTFQNWEYLSSLVNAGLIKNLGISIYTREQFDGAIRCPHISVIQIPFNVLDGMKIKGDQIIEAKKRGKILHIRSIFLQGLLLMEEENISKQFHSLLPAIRSLHKIAKENELSKRNLCLLYPLSLNCFDGVILGAEKPSQLRDNLTSLGTSLASTIIKKIEEIKVEEESLLNPMNWK